MAASSRNLAILGEGYAPASELQDRSVLDSPIWEVDAVSDIDSHLQQQLADRLQAAMIFPGKDILDQQLCSRDDLHLICKEALGYAKSSPELLAEIDEDKTDQLLAEYLSHQGRRL